MDGIQREEEQERASRLASDGATTTPTRNEPEQLESASNPGEAGDAAAFQASPPQHGAVVHETTETPPTASENGWDEQEDLPMCDAPSMEPPEEDAPNEQMVEPEEASEEASQLQPSEEEPSVGHTEIPQHHVPAANNETREEPHEPTVAARPANDDAKPPLEDAPAVPDAHVHDGRAQESAGEEVPPVAVDPPEPLEDSASHRVPDQVLADFTQQLQRLEENFAAERDELMRQHARELDQLRATMTHEECQAQRALLETSYQQQVEQLEERLHDIAGKNEGYRLKIDVLQREVDGTKKLLEERDGDMGKTQEEHAQMVKTLQENLQREKQKSSQLEMNIKGLNENLETARKQTESLQHQTLEMKERMKTIAVELKERRQECRQLKMQVDSDNESKLQLQSEVDNLRLQLSNHGLSSSEKQEEMEHVKVTLVDAQTEIRALQQALKDQEIHAEKVLADYKKKAQNSLALSNARAAAAVQAKEEAELEARSARNTADAAMDKAVQAELVSKKEVAEMRHQLQEMERERQSSLRERDECKARLLECESQLERTDQGWKESEAIRERAAEEYQRVESSLRETAALLSNAKLEIEETKRKESTLRQDLSTAREELQQLRKLLAAAQASAASSEAADNEKPSSAPPQVKSVSLNEQESISDAAEEALALLQHELKEVREANEDLKQALASVISENESLKESRDLAAGGVESGSQHQGPSRTRSSDAESTPLFYAIEKQAELKTARDEIARLANFLSKVQSEKSEAEEAMDMMRHKLEEAETRLKLFEKFGRRKEPSDESVTKGIGINREDNSGIVNIEYLKNIMLRYLNAKTVKEKKALVPAIGAVLEFTPDEQRSAVQNVENGASLGGVGSSLFETISFKLGT